MTIGLGLIIASIISAFAVGAGSLYQNRQNVKNQQKAYEQQKELMSYEASLNEKAQDRTYRLYNSPVAQRKAQEAAGLNPFANGSAIQSMSTSSPEVSGGTPPNFAPVNNPFAGFQSVADSVATGATMHQQQELMDARVARENAETNKVLLESEGLKNTLNLKEYTDQIVKNAALNGKLQNRISQFQADILEIEKNYAPDQQAAKLAELWSREESQLAQAAKSYEEREMISRMSKFVEQKERSVIDLNEANADLAREQKEKVSQDINESVSREALNYADVETKNAVRSAVVRDAEAKAALAEAEEALIESNRGAREKQNELNNWLADQVMDRKPTESYYKMALDLLDRYLEFRGQNIDRKAAQSTDKSLYLGMILRYMISVGLK